MSGPTPFSQDGLPLFTEERPAVVILGDLLDYIQEMRQLYDDTQELYKVLQDNLSFIGSGSPKGIYPSLTALQTEKPTGDTFIYVTTDNGNWYYWNGSAWVSGGVYQATQIEKKSVTPEKTSFFIESSNLFDPSKINQNTLLYSGNGQTTTVSNYITTDFIQVNQLTNVTIRYARGYSLYNSNKQFISGVDSFKTNWSIPLNGAFYIRFCWDTTDLALNLQQMNSGESLLPYEPYRVFIPNQFLDQLFDSKRIGEKTLSTDQMNFIGIGSNLFNYKNVEKGKFLYDNGFVASGSNFVLSDYISVLNMSTLTIKNIWHYCFYDQNKKWISGQSLTQKQNVVLNIPSNVHFIRFSWAYDGNEYLIESQQVNKGSKLLPFETYTKKLNTEEFPIYNQKELKLNLPEKIYGVIGYELNIYFDNILNENASDYQFFVTCNKGIQNKDYYRLTPNATGNTPIKISVLKDGKELCYGESTIIIKSPKTESQSVMVIGDSTTASGEVIQKLKENYPASLMVGTMGTAPYKNEGRSGWTALQYTTVSVDANNNSVTNAFWNPNSQLFDFDYYLNQNGLTAPDHVILNLGINDVFVYTDDYSLKNRINQFIVQYQFMVQSIKLNRPNLKVGIAVTIPPNDSQNSFGRAYGTGQTRWRYKKNNFALCERIISEFKNKENDNLYLVPIHLNLDTVYNFPVDAQYPEVFVNARNTKDKRLNYATSAGVHPAVSGYWQIADSYYAYLSQF